MGQVSSQGAGGDIVIAGGSLSALLSSSAGLVNRTSMLVDKLVERFQNDDNVDPELVMRTHELAVRSNVQIMDSASRLMKIAKEAGKAIGDDDLSEVEGIVDNTLGGMGNANSRLTRTGGL